MLNSIDPMRKYVLEIIAKLELPNSRFLTVGRLVCVLNKRREEKKNEPVLCTKRMCGLSTEFAS